MPLDGSKRRLKQYVISGVNKDLPAAMIADELFTDLVNAEPFGIGVKGSDGIGEVLGTPLFPPRHLDYFSKQGNGYWVYAGDGGCGTTVNGIAHFDISPTLGVTPVFPAGVWTSCQLAMNIIFNNAVDNPWYYNGGGIMTPLPGWFANTQAKAVRSFKNHLIALNLTETGVQNENKLAWSDRNAGPLAVPTTWAAATTNQAGSAELVDTVGALEDGIQIRDQFLVFKDHSTYICDYIAGNFVFRFRKFLTTSGILHTNCAAEYLGNAVVLTDGDVVLTNGQQVESLVDKKMKNWLFSQIDATNFDKCFVVSSISRNQVWICIPEAGETEATLALVWDANDNRFGIRELSPKAAYIARGLKSELESTSQDWNTDTDTWDSDTTIWNTTVFSPTDDTLVQCDRVNTKFYEVGKGNTYAGSNIATRIEKRALDLDFPDNIKLVRQLTPRIVGDVGVVVQIQIGYANDDSDVVTWKPAIAYTIGQTQRLNVLAQGKYIAVKAYSEADQSAWQCLGFDFVFEVKGQY